MSAYQLDAFSPENAGSTIAVWFSCGAASATAAFLTKELYGDSHTIRVINNPVFEEHPDNIRFKDQVQDALGIEIETQVNPKYKNCSAREVWERRGYMAGVFGAPCTTELKKEARRAFQQKYNPRFHVMGFTAEEEGRHEDFIDNDVSLLPVLIDAGFTKKDCFEYIARLGIKRPKIYDLGYPNANCIGCVKSSSPTYWNHVRKVHPEIFADRAEQSKRLGARLVRVKGERIFLHELGPDVVGRPMTEDHIECGVFCQVDA